MLLSRCILQQVQFGCQKLMTETISVMFHNLEGYDSHLLLQELGKFSKKISVILNNMHTYYVMLC